MPPKSAAKTRSVMARRLLPPPSSGKEAEPLYQGGTDMNSVIYLVGLVVVVLAVLAFFGLR